MTSTKSSKILIAGISGIIGQYLFTKLPNKSTDIYGIDYETSNYENYTKVDLTNQKSLNSFISSSSKFDVLIFLVGLAHSKGKNKDYNEFKTVNYQTLVNLLKKLNEKRITPEKIIFSSTISVYGERWSTNEYFEDTEINPNSPYAKTKLLAENYLLKNYKERVFILRFAPVYSSEFTLNLDRRTKIGSVYYKLGSGKKKLSLLNSDNIINAIESIISGKVPPGIYNLSDKKIYSYDELLKWQKAKKIISIPNFLGSLVYFLGKMTGNNFLIENSIKLATDNLFSANKISEYVELKAQLQDI